MELKCVPNAGVIDPVEELFHLETHISPTVSGSLSTLSAYKHVHNVVSIYHVDVGKMNKWNPHSQGFTTRWPWMCNSTTEKGTFFLSVGKGQIIHIFTPACTTDTCRELWIAETASEKCTHIEVNMSTHANKAPVELFYLTIWWVWHVYWTS